MCPGICFIGENMNIDSILINNSLVDLVSKDTELHKNNSEWRGACPIHRSQNKNGFAIYEDKGKWYWKCYSGDCGGGDVIDYIQKMNNCDFNTACRILGGETTEKREVIVNAASERLNREIIQMQEEFEKHKALLDALLQTQIWIQYSENLQNDNNLRSLWRKRGIPDVFQDIWQLGYCPSFPVSTPHGKWNTPTLTIPVFGEDSQPLTIRHRLLNPPTPNDKYRPERPGLHSHPYLTDPEHGYSLDRILVVEGEIKSMVTYLTLDDTNLQVIGIPGKNNFRNIEEKLIGHNVTILFDPDALQQSVDAARKVKGRIINLTMKVDDAINDRILDKYSLKRLLADARRVL